eukprot:180661-Rhodomonas_salina.1
MCGPNVGCAGIAALFGLANVGFSDISPFFGLANVECAGIAALFGHVAPASEQASLSPQLLASYRYQVCSH